MPTFDETLIDDVSVGSTLAVGRITNAPPLSDTVTNIDFPEVLRLIPVLETQGIGIASELLERVGIIIREQIRLVDSAPVVHKQQVYLADIVRLAAGLYSVHPADLTDGIGVASSMLVAQATTMAERLGLADALTASGRYNFTISQAVRLADRLYQFFGAEVDEGINLAVDLLVRKLAVATATDAIGIEDVMEPRFLISAVVEEGVEITAEQAVQMLFNPTIFEGVEINAGFLSPSGSLTTWAMNARNGAVTEYTNFEFNSFAKIGNRYVGASETGLYELLGDDDAGDNIIARIKGGFLQFGGTHLSRLSAAYIAARGEGQFILRIVTGEGATYNYVVDTRNMRSTKVHMGKGQRARYFSYELISSGQDFDLDTLEFVPVVVQRRV